LDLQLKFGSTFPVVAYATTTSCNTWTCRTNTLLVIKSIGHNNHIVIAKIWSKWTTFFFSGGTVVDISRFDHRDVPLFIVMVRLG
jgi:hypothetical protein